jgi:hypothetical protein
MVCPRNISIDTLHKGDTANGGADDDDNDDDNNNNNNNTEKTMQISSGPELNWNIFSRHCLI